MRNRKRKPSRIIANAISSKSQTIRCAGKSQRLMRIAAGLKRGHEVYSPGLTDWYQLRKRVQQRLRNLSNGNLTIHENGFRVDNDILWLKNHQPCCEHVFKASMKSVVLYGADRICPFCHGTNDMKRYGTVAAVQEHVHGISSGNIEFLDDNILSSSSDSYQFKCTIHGILFDTSFDDFLSQSGDVCPFCDHEKFNWT